ncbi:hypothetical protein U91I_02909 [alpha proteobacterium U9-1i]|nr:hypothetical protein U91I_02909 [alpha proteobacterium U9-1i]
MFRREAAATITAMRRAFLTGLLAVSLAACASTSAAPQRYSGVWDWHFETSSFRTDEGRGPYWLSGEGAVWDQLNAPLQARGQGPWGRLRIVVEGELSEPGRYGHLGAYERELRVTRVISSEIATERAPTGS